MNAIEPQFNFSIDRLPKHPIFKHRDYEKNHEIVFGSVSKEDLIGKVYVCRERISENYVDMFWNRETGEVVKLLGNTIYAHYNEKENSLISGEITTIPESVFISHGYTTMPTHRLLSVPARSFDMIERESSDFPGTVVTDDEEEAEIERILHTKIGCLPSPPDIPCITQDKCSIELPSHTNITTVSDDADISSFECSDSETENTNTEPNQITTNRQSNEKNYADSAFVSPKAVTENIVPVKTFSMYTKKHNESVLKLKYDNADLIAQIMHQDSIIRQLNQTIQMIQMEVKTTKSMAAYYKNEIEQIRTELRTKEDNIEVLNQHCREYKEKLEKAEEALRKLKRMINEPREPSFELAIKYFDSVDSQSLTVTKLGWSMQREMFINSHKNAFKRQYIESSKQFFWVINSQSSVAYDTLRKVFPIPCFNTFHSIMRSRVIDTECSLLDVKFIASFVQQFIRQYTHGNITAALAIDAIVVSPKDMNMLKSEFRAVSPKLLKAFNTQISLAHKVQTEPTNDVFRAEYTESQKEIIEDQSKETLRSSSQQEHFKKQVIETKKEVFNNVFIFYIEPLNPNIPCFPVHIWLQHGGSANEVIRKLTEHIILQVEKSKTCTIRHITTDGDLGHQPQYTEAMKKLLNISITLDIDEIYKHLRVRSGLKLAAADMLHFLKTMRTKILLHILSLFPHNISSLFDMHAHMDVFGVGKEITDLSHIGKMRDVYPILFFSLRNLMNLKKKGIWTGVLLFIPWSLWIAATMNTAFTIKSRLIMLEICYEHIKRFYNVILTNEKWDSAVGEVGRNSKAFLTFVSQSVLERLIPTLVVFISSLRNFIEIKDLVDKSDAKLENAENESNSELKSRLIREGNALKEQAIMIGKMFGFPDDISLDFAFQNLGTHPLENFNGNIRDTAHNNDKIVSTSRIIARAHVQKCLKQELGIKNAKRNRINIAGVKLNQSKDICDIPPIDPVIVTDSLFIIADAVTNETVLQKTFAPEMVDSLFDFIEDAVVKTEKNKCMADLTVPISTRNASIDSRNFGYA